ncbi:hypothetical protein [Modestobacter lapidis]
MAPDADYWEVTTATAARETALVDTTTVAAARSRAHGPTAALWHAVEVHRDPSEVDGACELTCCGVLARVTTERSWPVADADVCPDCRSLTR